jgi:glycyl-tRNA synthetase beta subunit
MIGPKSTRYTLTFEQRRILAEARERERKTQQELEKLRAYKTEISVIKSQLLKETTNIDMLVERANTGIELQI